MSIVYEVHLGHIKTPVTQILSHIRLGKGRAGFVDERK